MPKVRKFFSRHIQKCKNCYRLSETCQKILNYLETFQTVRKLSRPSGNFPDCSETFLTDWKLSRLSENFPDCPEIFQTVQKLSRLSGNFSNCLETFQTENVHTFRKLFRLPGHCPAEAEKPRRRVGIADRKVFARPESFCMCLQNWPQKKSKHSISLERFRTV